jgi:hypothetical protein
VNAVGYHDHNWGVWPGTVFNWVWAQFFSQDSQFTMVLGAYKVIRFFFFVCMCDDDDDDVIL